MLAAKRYQNLLKLFQILDIPIAHPVCLLLYNINISVDVPGCWVRFPSGCPKQESHQSRTLWYYDNFPNNAHGSSSSATKCFAREGPLNDWCGVSDVIVQYVEGMIIINLFLPQYF